jgi:hypothetical protein
VSCSCSPCPGSQPGSHSGATATGRCRAGSAALALFYAVNAAIAAFVDTRYVVAALFASLIPLSALLLLIATARSKPPGAESDETDPVPGLSAQS